MVTLYDAENSSWISFSSYDGLHWGKLSYLFCPLHNAVMNLCIPFEYSLCYINGNLFRWYISSLNKCIFCIACLAGCFSLPLINSHQYSYIQFYWICMQCYVEETARLRHQNGLEKPSSSRALSTLFLFLHLNQPFFLWWLVLRPNCLFWHGNRWTSAASITFFLNHNLQVQEDIWYYDIHC